MKQLIFCTVVMFHIVGCKGLSSKKITDNYFLIAMDYEKEKTNLSYKISSGDYIGVITSTVFAVGYNEDFIIAKQHPRKFPNPPDKSITNYFIIPIKDKVRQSPDDNKIGPLTESEFKEKRKELGIPDEVTFSIVLKDLE